MHHQHNLHDASDVISIFVTYLRLAGILLEPFGAKVSFGETWEGKTAGKITDVLAPPPHLNPTNA